MQFWLESVAFDELVLMLIGMVSLGISIHQYSTKIPFFNPEIDRRKSTGNELTWLSRYLRPVLSNIFLLERASTTDISSGDSNLANFNARSTFYVFKNILHLIGTSLVRKGRWKIGKLESFWFENSIWSHIIVQDSLANHNPSNKG